MANTYTYVPYGETGYFSHLVTDYLSKHPATQQFYRFNTDAAGIAQAIEERAKYPVNRQTLADVLTKQYAELPQHDKVTTNIALLRQENTYTICTAHQPNLLTGYLYFIYKIIHAIKLAEELTEQHPGKNFVPVYYMGSEDNDIEELGTFRFRGDKYVWDGSGQSGAVGRMSTAGLKPLLQQLFKVFGPPGKHSDELTDIITKAYLQHKTIGAATQYLVNELFGRYGLIVLDPDEAALKEAYIPVMKDELLHQRSYEIVSAQINELEQNYKIQAHPRHINLFYLTDQLRERIEKQGQSWVVVNTDIKWSEQEMLAELNGHPERFSPNVILRGMYQETILPNVAFIGGGAEVAYWLQLKTLFGQYTVFYPAILLRQSVMWVHQLQARQREQTGLSLQELFKQEDELVRSYVSKHSGNEWQTSIEETAMESIFEKLKAKATALDPTLTSSAEASLAKIKKQLHILEQKMLRAEKRKMDTQLDRLVRLRNALFPGNGLQERVENFAEYYLEYGPPFFDIIKNGIRPLNGALLIIE